MTAALILPLRCPLCPSHSTLTAPVTLYCGHTVCAIHVSLPHRPPESPQPHTHVPILLRLTPCPLQGCTASPSAPPAPLNIPSSSRVTFFPAVSHEPDRDAAFATIPDSRVDVTVNNLATIIHRYDQQLQAHSPQHLPGADSGEGPSSIPRQGSSDGSQQRPARMGARKRRRKRLPPPRRLDAPAQSADQFEKELLAELSCEICLTLYYQPITSPCQHTFCTKCLHRSLDHSNQCPLCRQLLPGFSYFQDHPFNKTILSIILKTFPEAYSERGRVIEQEERHSRLDTPIFVCQLSFPGLPTVVHFFEPRYRLMLRRCFEKSNPNPCFGMIMPPTAAGGRSSGNDFGTMLEIKGVKMLHDGRSIVETRGTYPFRIMERGTMDGYMVARIERCSFSPYFKGGARASDYSFFGMQQLTDACRAFLVQIQRGAAPWVVQRLNYIYGPMPTDPTHFSYWMAMVLPIEDTEKAKLLPMKSPLLRLRLVVHWIEQLNSHWFVGGCAHGRCTRID
ncbi:PUA-like domain-containing protein [Russula aff. rugulosa BPL654]|nr:PUA-like domain-containing protein [Russula aff. rugulosa BPL654]